MKFLTEAALKQWYKTSQEKHFVLEDDMRLTPGGRQFLNDKGIQIQKSNDLIEKNESTECLKENNGFSFDSPRHYKIQSIKAQLWRTGLSLIEGHVTVAKQLFEFADALDQEDAVLECSLCETLECLDDRELMKPCFNLSSFYVQLPCGKHLLSLNALLLDLQTFYLWLSQNDEAHVMLSVKKMLGYVHYTICKLLGGTECQRKQQDTLIAIP